MLAIGGSPFWTLVVLVPAGFLVGIVLQKVVFDRLVGVDPAYQIVATFGLSIVLQNVLLRGTPPTAASLDIGSLKNESISIGDLSIGLFPLLRFVVAVAVLASLSLFLRRTRLGQGLPGDVRRRRDRAADGHRQPHHLHGRPRHRRRPRSPSPVCSTAPRRSFASADGPVLLIFAFEAVIIGGLGSLWGTLAGGMMLGVAQTLGAEQFNDWPAQLFGHLVFLAVLVVRPHGLFGKEDT